MRSPLPLPIIFRTTRIVDVEITPKDVYTSARLIPGFLQETLTTWTVIDFRVPKAYELFIKPIGKVAEMDPTDQARTDPHFIVTRSTPIQSFADLGLGN